MTNARRIAVYARQRRLDEPFPLGRLTSAQRRRIAKKSRGGQA